MNYGYLDDQCLKELKPQGDKLVQYYNDHIEKIAEILGVDKGYIKRVMIILEQGEGAGYSQEDKKIYYRFLNKNNILHDKGKLIHEAAHVVQDYPHMKNIILGHPCFCWMEGLADYCRAIIDKDFNIEEGLRGDPIECFHYKDNTHINIVYRDNAYFLKWLNNKFRDNNIIHKLHQLIHNDPNNFMDAREVLKRLIDDMPTNVLHDYYEEKKNKFITS
jgi:hypothetical protein